MHQGPTSQSLLKLDMFVFNSFGCGLVMKMAWAGCGSCFFGHLQQHDLDLHYMNNFRCCFFCSLKGLNLVSSICMGLFFGEITKGWVDITCEKLVCVNGGVKLLCVVDVGSWLFFCLHSKNLLSHWTICAMAQLNVKRSGMVSNKSFTSPHNPNWN